jgi:ER membrane protein complex subunit 3
MLIDPAIRDWVMIPLLVLVVLSVYLRVYAMRLLSDTKPADRDEVVQRGMVQRSARLRANCGYISYPGFVMRKDFLSAEGFGKLTADLKPAAAAAGGPMQQMDMMKTQVGGSEEAAASCGGLGRAAIRPGLCVLPLLHSSLIPPYSLASQFVMMGTQLGLGMFTQSFTSGFVALQLPFGLTERFKGMTQAGIAVSQALDTTYVSSTSWYMMTAFGLPRLMQLFTKSGSGAVDEAKMMQMQVRQREEGAQEGGRA